MDGTGGDRWKEALRLTLTLVAVAALIVVAATIAYVLLILMLQQSSDRHENGEPSAAVEMRLASLG